jgi:hypothetical protein
MEEDGGLPGTGRPYCPATAYRGTRWQDTSKIEVNLRCRGEASMSEKGQTEKNSV